MKRKRSKPLLGVVKISTVKIHPAIGVARLGNSPDEFFIGPEVPWLHVKPRNGYRDKQHRIKRQAARFRLFGYDKKGKLVGEVTSAQADITWTVHLANSKAEWKQFDGLNTNAERRNSKVKDRSTLIIDSGPRSVQGTNKSANFDTGQFLGAQVPLGQIRSDNHARLLVLGGSGNSGSPTGRPLKNFANNDGWHDDVSDGPVNASVKLKIGGKTLSAIGAWVIVGPPKYAPTIENVVTLYDVLTQIAVDKLGLKLPAKPSFARDIYPLLQRATLMRWVSGMVAHPKMHAGEHMPSGGKVPPAHSTFSQVLPPPGTAAARKKIFDKLRNPALSGKASSDESDMPMMHSDFAPVETNLALTRVQYEAMRKWKNGNFINDWSGTPPMSKEVTPQGLDRAGLDSCVGGPFFPGIEASWLLRDKYKFSEPYRLDPSKLKPGDITKQMALPWQADFHDCTQEGELAWWPAQRPDDVFPEAGGKQAPWIRGIVNSKEDMIKKWHRLGFIVKKGAKYVETSRRP